MKLAHLSDDNLLFETDKLVKNEREILTAILHHLREIERRRLFSKLKYSSLYDYAVKRLGYSEDQAYRRIAAMRLLKEIPELEEKITEGRLNLTHMGMAQSFFKREAKIAKQTLGKAEKLQIIATLENKSKQDSERQIFALSTDPMSLRQDKIRSVSENHLEIKFTASQALGEKIQKLKGILAHSHPNISLEELFTKLCDLGIERLGKAAAKSAPARDATRANSQASIYRTVWKRAESKCQLCESTFALEIDHIRPKALGGDSELTNLRLLCRSCNQRAAIEKLGLKKMDRHLN